MKPERLTIQALRQETYLSWEMTAVASQSFVGLTTEDVDGATAQRLCYTNEEFKANVRKRFGDLRRRDTWERAAIAFCAHAIVGSYFEPYQIVGQLLSPDYMNDPIRRIYGLEVVESALQWPGINEVIQEGLAAIYVAPKSYPREFNLLERLKADRSGLELSTPLSAQILLPATPDFG